MPSSPSNRAGVKRRSESHRLRQVSPIRRVPPGSRTGAPRRARSYPTDRPAWPRRSTTTCDPLRLTPAGHAALALRWHREAQPCSSTDDGAADAGPHRTKCPAPGRGRAWVILCTPPGEVVLEGVGGGRGSAREAELGEDVAHMPGHGLLADRQPVGDRPVGSARRHAARAPQSRAAVSPPAARARREPDALSAARSGRAPSCRNAWRPRRAPSPRRPRRPALGRRAR